MMPCANARFLFISTLGRSAFCAMLLLWLASPLAFLSAEDSIAVIKSYKHGVVAISPQSGDVRFFTNVITQHDYYEDYRIFGVDADNDNLAILYYKRGRSGWYNAFIMLNLRNGGMSFFDPQASGFSNTSVDDFCSSGKGAVAIHLANIADEKGRWVLHSLLEHKVVSTNYSIKPKQRYDIDKIKAWQNSWCKDTAVLLEYPQMTSSEAAEKLKLDWDDSHFLLTGLDGNVKLFNGGPLNASTPASLACDLSEYACLINGLRDSPWFCCLQTSTYDLRPDYEEFKRMKTCASQSDKRTITREMAVSMFADHLKSAISISDKILKTNNMSSVDDFINSRVECNSRYYWIDESISFEAEQANDTISFPLQIRMAIDSTLPLNKSEMEFSPCAFKSPLIWFSINKGEILKRK